MNKNQIPTLSYCIVALICLLVLSSCTSNITRDNTQLIAAKANQAQQWVSSGEYLQAAQLYVQIAELAETQDQSTYLLQAAELYQKMELYDVAMKALTRVNSKILQAPQYHRYQLAMLAN